MRDMQILFSPTAYALLKFFTLLSSLIFVPPTVAAKTFRATKMATTLTSPRNACVNRSNGVLLIRLSNGEERRYRSNLKVKGGTYVKYRYKGYLKKIDAYVIEAEKMNSETIFLSDRTGKEAYIGNAYSISPNGKIILSAGCTESQSCFYELIEWPSAQRKLFKEQERATGIAIAPNRPQETPVKWTSIRWRSNAELFFFAVCVVSRGKTGFTDISLKYVDGRWQQKSHSCIDINPDA
jgi:hypothetical protein